MKSVLKRGWSAPLLIAIVGLVALLGVFTPAALSQGGTGELTGVVYDPAGATVSDAKVTLTNAGTGFDRDMQTGAGGVYRFTALPVVGTYALTVEHGGFRKAQVSGIVISVGTAVTVDVHLELGTATEAITVEAGAELVTPSESEISQLIDRRVWQNLPLEVRNQNTFINLVAGAVPNQFSGTTRGAAVNGARPGSGNFLLEGFDDNDIGQGGRGSEGQGAVTSISPEAIQEFRVITHNFEAEYGKGGGFVTDTVLKSGTDQLHGSLFEYNRVQALAAEDFFTNKSGGKDSLVRNQFGGSLGGPIIKNKWFFFGSYEGHRRVQTSPLPSTSVLTPDFLNFVKSGQFETFMETDPNGFCMQATGKTCPGTFSQSSTLGPNFAKLASTQPFPTAAGGACLAATDPNFRKSANPCASQGFFASAAGLGVVYPVAEFGQVAFANPDRFNQHRVSFKSDYKISDKDSLTGTFTYTNSDDINKFGGGDGTIGPAFENPDVQLLLGIAWTHNFSATILNQARASYLRHRADFPNPAGTAGIPDILSAQDSLGVGFGNTSALPQFFTDGMFQYKDDLSIVKGRHTFKVGGEYRRVRNASSFEAEKNGIFFFESTEELVTDGFFGDVADKILNGAPTTGSIFEAGASLNPLTGGFPEYYRGYRANEGAVYGQDDWKILPRLTLNLGLRWEYFGVPHNYQAGLDSNIFFPTTPAPLTPNGNPFLPVNSIFAENEAGARAMQVNSGLWNKDEDNFAPRVGFAWDVFGTQKFVVRGGGGIFYDRIYDNVFENIRFNPPLFNFATLGTAFVPAAGAIGPIDSPGLYTVPFTSPAPFAPFAPLPSGRHIDQNLRAPYTQQANLGIQYGLSKDFVLEVNGTYTGGRELIGVVDVNTYNGRRACDGAEGAAQGAKCAAAFAAGEIPSATFTGRRPNPTLASDGFRSNAYGSTYYGLQVSMTKRFSGGLQFNSNYTWSHAIDTLSDAFNGGAASGTALVAGPTDVYNVSADKGNADFDVRHRFVTTAYYELPIFKQNRWLGGWSMDGILTLQKGVPIPIVNGTTSGDTNRDGHTTDRPAITGNPYLSGMSPADGFLNPASFARYTCPSTVNFGLFCDSPTGRNTLIGPGFVNTDFGMAKKFRINERMALQFQANFFDLFNHPNFKTPQGSVFGNASQFGMSTSTFSGTDETGGHRITQLALRLDF
jgi:hypothetical protein